MTSKVSAPRLDWLNFVVTKQATSKIKQWYKKNKREDHIEIGKANLEHELTKTVFDEYVKNGEFEKIHYFFLFFNHNMTMNNINICHFILVQKLYLLCQRTYTSALKHILPNFPPGGLYNFTLPPGIYESIC